MIDPNVLGVDAGRVKRAEGVPVRSGARGEGRNENENESPRPAVRPNGG